MPQDADVSVPPSIAQLPIKFRTEATANANADMIEPSTLILLLASAWLRIALVIRHGMPIYVPVSAMLFQLVVLLGRDGANKLVVVWMLVERVKFSTPMAQPVFVLTLLQLEDAVPPTQTSSGTLISADATANPPHSSAALVSDLVRTFAHARYNVVSQSRLTQLVLLVFVLMLPLLSLVEQKEYGMTVVANATVLLLWLAVQWISSGVVSNVLVSVNLKLDASGPKCWTVRPASASDWLSVAICYYLSHNTNVQ